MTPAPLQVPADRIQVGQLRAAYGIAGWLWVYSYTDPMTNLFDYLPWWLETATGWQQVSVKRWRTQGKGLVVLLSQVSNRTEAEQYCGASVWIDRSCLPAPALDEFYWNDLIGLTVMGHDDTGQAVNLGQVHELFETGANDVMVVRATPDSVDGEERMIPWHREVVQAIDLQARLLTVNWGADY